MRQFFSLDWSGGIVGAIENTVRENFPRDLRLWPLLQAFDWEAFSLGDRYFVTILKDKLQGIPAGNGTLIPFPHTDYPPLPPTRANVLQWQSYLIQKFGLRNEDAAMILPIHDCGRKILLEIIISSPTRRKPSGVSSSILLWRDRKQDSRLPKPRYLRSQRA